jgi:hypothetical protein
MGPFGLSNEAFDGYMVYFSVVIFTLSLGVKVSIGTPNDCEDCTMSGEGINLLQGFLDLRWGWMWWVGFGFDLGVGVSCCWVCDLWNCWGAMLFGELTEGMLFGGLAEVAGGWL